MLCSRCKSDLFELDRTWGYHCFSGFNCTICSQLRADVSPLISELDKIPTQNPLHWWKLRRSARIRESPEFYSLVFTPDTNKHPALREAPIRTFYLFEYGTVCIATELSDRTDSEDVLSRMKSWLRLCEEPGHSQCSTPKKPTWIPKRLISIGSAMTDQIYVVETEKLAATVDRYMTLSHCWGDPKTSPLNLRLTVEDEASFQDPTIGITWAELPQNFRDAIQIARQLGVRYLWIDALCIIQDNDEFHQEGQLMHLVYRNSFCTLAAAASKDSQGGLFRNRNTKSLIPRALEIPGSSILGKKLWTILSSDMWLDQLLGQSLYQRGWVFQERILSPRLLHFSSNQVFWDCASMSACELLPEGLPTPLDVAAALERHWRQRLRMAETYKTVTGTADDSVEDFWRRGVRIYTACDLTHSKDRMPAIWSVAKLVRDQMRREYGKQEYGAGLWSSFLHEQLAWRVVDPEKAYRPGILSQYPTWSWASLIGEIDLRDRFSDRNRFYGVSNHDGNGICFELSQIPEDLSSGLADSGNDLQQELRTNNLAVRGNLIRVVLRRTDKFQGSGDSIPGRFRSNTYTLRPDHNAMALTDDNFEVFLDTQNAPQEDDTEVYLLILTASKIAVPSLENTVHTPAPAKKLSSRKRTSVVTYGTGLILKKVSWVPVNKQSNSHFQRIAVCHFQGIKLSVFNSLSHHVAIATNLWLI